MGDQTFSEKRTERRSEEVGCEQQKTQKRAPHKAADEAESNQEHLPDPSITVDEPEQKRKREELERIRRNEEETCEEEWNVSE